MERSVRLKPSVGVTRQAASLGPPLLHLPDAADAMLAEKRDPRRPGALAKASSLVERLVQQAPASAPGLKTDHADLVSRALAILAEEAATWQAREGAKPATRSIR